MEPYIDEYTAQAARFALQPSSLEYCKDFRTPVRGGLRKSKIRVKIGKRIGCFPCASQNESEED